MAKGDCDKILSSRIGKLRDEREGRKRK